MRAVVQKCNWCKVDSEGEETASISKGFVVLLGVKKGDTEKEAEYIADKVALENDGPVTLLLDSDKNF